MAARYIRNTLILAKVETTPGTDASPVGGTDAVLVSDFSITPLDAQNIDRALVRGYFGGSEQLVGTASIKISFTVELAGSGTAATAPQWGDLLQGCAHAESLLSTPNRVEYNPVSTSLKTLTIYYYDDGVLHKALYCMGNVKLSAKVSDRPKLMFDFVGTDGGISAASASGTFTAWKKPVPVTKANVVDVTLGCTYSAGALSGGTAYASQGPEFDWGNNVQFVPTLTYEQVDIIDRSITGKVTFDLTAANEVSFMATVKANSTQSLGFTLGSAAGNKIIVYAPAVQLTNPTKADVQGRRMIAYDMRLLPSSGNDDILIVTQ